MSSKKGGELGLYKNLKEYPFQTHWHQNKWYLYINGLAHQTYNVKFFLLLFNVGQLVCTQYERYQHAWDYLHDYIQLPRHIVTIS